MTEALLIFLFGMRLFFGAVFIVTLPIMFISGAYFKMIDWIINKIGKLLSNSSMQKFRTCDRYPMDKADGL